MPTLHLTLASHPPTPPAQRCLPPPSALEGDCGFLAANLYARSVFGEDALVNVSVEKLPDGRLAGYIRIRWACLRARGGAELAVGGGAIGRALAAGCATRGAEQTVAKRLCWHFSCATRYAQPRLQVQDAGHRTQPR